MDQPIIPPRKVSELVVERLMQRVERGEWPVGTRIPAEPELVAELGVGRNTVREAVRALEHAGILEPRRGDGTYVRAADGLDAALTRRARTTDALHVLEVREILERGAARAAAGQADADALHRLDAALAAQVAARDGDEQAFQAADVAFHGEVVRAAGNPLLADLYDGLDHALVRTLPAGGQRRHHRDVPGHAEVVAAVRAGDAEAAEAAVVATIDAVRAQLVEAAADGPGRADADAGEVEA
ncbi:MULTISPECIES: FadR/GntR family transcriptional regulator [Cellulosimicrobium]|uniref:FadR family transcriptional regulator n=1 Tax=Cellulosimicrobium funkei TaxID=264251 RepID=A0A4Y8R326_9MICO|nr:MULTISPECIES: FCD domain-containing protein [Cellulosimicrobium]MCM3534910.1 FCD domain-containing protein [Cellulosimicrobium funkei]TFF11461.1 FadR family transcriptional regulator [Cellulosimicrobium funkei]TGA75214.1 FadR family transcriptional regulator [Cellulosimicrobium terreum]